ncbi:2-keto-4-pentenoate hydratase/2-oxohepta-3-ene-1,7-dioic acid hydratase in catechol pathway [Rhodoligotrophos appendicifer]|uniref:fumarylacetoacetate hydrolase family protein n=1 Tax=Rhodoligotrophos appendicifer TaxID=987056 RepID=UPI001186E4F3|nr:fumarylacetoacetate hydrolase family protein [Rhodoligotrophos appendicifer]
MKLVRYGDVGSEKAGLIDKQGRIRQLVDIVDDITPEALHPKNLDQILAADPEKLPIVMTEQRIGACITHFQKFLAIGLNYTDHAEETGAKAPSEPIVFSKQLNCVVGPNDDVLLPRGSVKSDWEVELGVVIGKQAKYIKEGQALDYVAGYCTVNDISEREYQIERQGQWTKGKSCDTFGPIGPWLVTKDEVKDPQNLRLWLDLNGKSMQDGSTKDMIFGVEEIVAYVSKFMTLMPGDLICTGTPAGVGLGKKPQIFLKAGDVMTLGVKGLGDQRQKVVADPEA